MTTALLVVVAVAAGLGCPAHMWWSMRRGRRAACCPPVSSDDSEAMSVHRRQQALGAQLATLDESAPARRAEGYAVRP